MGRDGHLEEFERLTGLMARMSRCAVSSIQNATKALLDGDAGAGDAVAHDRAEITRLHLEIDTLVPLVLARQQPFATDLRLVMAAVRINSDLHRMGALASHIAKVGRQRRPSVPPQARPILTAMAASATALAEKSSMALAGRDELVAIQLGLDDDVTDALQRELFRLLTGDWREGTPAAVEVAMVGRFYERFADHAVSVGKQVAYLVTGSAVTGRL